jgi:hypothetical protein
MLGAYYAVTLVQPGLFWHAPPAPGLLSGLWTLLPVRQPGRGRRLHQGR